MLVQVGLSHYYEGVRMKHLVFLYGTLRPSLRKKYGFYGVYMPMGRLVAEGTIQATIHPLGGRVPGIRLSDDPKDKVVGEVVEVDDRELDIFDGLEFPAGYERVRTSVTCLVDEDGSTEVFECFTYQFCHPKELGKKVKSGNWAEYLENSKGEW